MLLHSNVITRIKIVSKVLSRVLLNTKLKFLVPLSIVNVHFLDGDVPRCPSYRVYISQLIKFARVCSHVVNLMLVINFNCLTSQTGLSVS